MGRKRERTSKRRGNVRREMGGKGAREGEERWKGKKRGCG